MPLADEGIVVGPVLPEQMHAEGADEIGRVTAAVGDVPGQLGGVEALDGREVLEGGQIIPERQRHHGEQYHGEAEPARGAARRPFMNRVL